ncbi:MAG: aldehyde dehydrogenase (NADP(+)) [Spirochaetaceae bacterium]|nr:MAG: aldehyde dehydrogenase (NADP(+)) [Spirochaetaceae bacterium]
MKLHGENMIGPRRTADGTETYRAVDPATDAELEPTFTDATESEIDAACRSALGASRAYAAVPAQTRAGFLRAIADQIEQLGDELVSRCVTETALPAARIVSERGRTTNQLRMFASLVEEGSWVDARIERPDAGRKPLPKPDMRRMLVPIGPVAVFGASNFPLAFSVAGGDTASALAAGNPVVVKAHPSHPGTSEMVGEAIVAAARESGMPDGVFSLVHGSSPRVGRSLVLHVAIRAVGFTGSHAAGRALFDAAAARPRPIPVYAEMGSVNPVVVLPGAAAERSQSVAQGLAASVTLGVGQFCTNPGVVFVPAEYAESFGRATADAVAAATGVMLNTRVCSAYTRTVGELRRRHDVSEVSSARDSAAAGAPGAAYAVPAVFGISSRAFVADGGLRVEVFGPATIVVSYDGIGELREAIESLDGQLTGTIHGNLDELAANRDLVDLLGERVGRLIFNGFPTGVEVCDAMNHGGPYPATTDVHFTSVGTAAILRFARPLCYQDFPADGLPEELADANPREILRRIDGEFTRDPV